MVSKRDTALSQEDASQFAAATAAGLARTGEKSTSEIAQLLVETTERRAGEAGYVQVSGNVLVSTRPAHAKPLHLAQNLARKSRKQPTREDPEIAAYLKEYRSTIWSSKPIEPHVYQMATRAFLHMRRTGRDQHISISGDHASGKTFMRKRLFEMFRAIGTHSGSEMKLFYKTCHAFNVIDAMTNATTPYNDSSSRVGLFTELQYSEKARLCGVKISDYLIDLTRVSTHATTSYPSNFHVFYQLLSGAPEEERELLHISDVKIFNYLQLYQNPETVDFTGQFADFRRSLKAIGITGKIELQIFRVLSAILHVGNLHFTSDERKKDEEAYVKDRADLDIAAHLLGVGARELESALTRRTQVIGREKCTILLDVEQSVVQRDVFARMLYALTFSWIIEQINSRLSATTGESDDAIHSVISFSDFPGLTRAQDGSLVSSSIKMLMLNYAAERLHCHYVQHTINQRDDDLVASRNVELELDLPDVRSCSSLFMSSSRGILASIDRHSRENALNGFTFLMEASTKNAKSAAFKLESLTTQDNRFTIKHFSGNASYDASQLVQSNLEDVSVDFIDLFADTERVDGVSNSFAANLFLSNILNKTMHPRNKQVVMTSYFSPAPRRAPCVAARHQDATRLLTATGQQSKKSRARQSSVYSMSLDAVDANAVLPADSTTLPKPNIPTLSAQLSDALDAMMDTIEGRNAWFIQCIGPLSSGSMSEIAQAAPRLAVEYQHQVYAGAIDVLWNLSARADYTVHMKFDEFQTRYDALHIQAEHGPYTDPEELTSPLSPVAPEYAADASVPLDGIPLEYRPYLNYMKDSGFAERDFFAANDIVYMSEISWRFLEDKMRANETADRKTRRPRSTATLSGIAASAARGDEDNAGSVYSDDLASNYSGDDWQSTYSGDDASTIHDEQKSVYSYHQTGGLATMTDLAAASLAGAVKPNEKDVQALTEETPKQKNVTSRARKWWIGFAWACTFYIPPFLLSGIGRMKRREIQMAWREKFALCVIVAFSCGFLIFFIAFFGELICPRQYVWSPQTLASDNGLGSQQPLFSVRGEVFDLSQLSTNHRFTVPASAIMTSAFAGQDLSNYMPLDVPSMCTGINGPINPRITQSIVNSTGTTTAAQLHDFRVSRTGFYNPNWYWYAMSSMRVAYRVGYVGYTPQAMALGASTGKIWASIADNIFDLTDYAPGGLYVLPDNNNVVGNGTISSSDMQFMSTDLVNLFTQNSGQDVTVQFENLPYLTSLQKRQQLICLRNLFFVGRVDSRESAKCLFSEYILLAATALLCCVILIKFLAALQLTTRREPEDHEKFVICQVPCYTEGEDSLRKTIDSLARLNYDDRRKLLFIIADGMIVGSGNDRPTPKIVLDLLGAEPAVDPEPQEFQSIGEGPRALNYGKVYSGLYECHGHVVPWIVVVKVGKPSEKSKPGNRGKRDSQMILMRFLNRVSVDEFFCWEICGWMRRKGGAGLWKMRMKCEKRMRKRPRNRVKRVLTRDFTPTHIFQLTRILQSPHFFIYPSPTRL